MWTYVCQEWKHLTSFSLLIWLNFTDVTQLYIDFWIDFGLSFATTMQLSLVPCKSDALFQYLNFLLSSIGNAWLVYSNDWVKSMQDTSGFQAYCIHYLPGIAGNSRICHCHHLKLQEILIYHWLFRTWNTESWMGLSLTKNIPTFPGYYFCTFKIYCRSEQRSWQLIWPYYEVCHLATKMSSYLEW